MPAFTYSRVASPLHDEREVARITAAMTAELDALGGRPVDDPVAEPSMPHAVVLATGGTERAALAVVRQRLTVVPWEPVVLVTHPLHNSLPAGLETLARLRADGVHGRIVPAAAGSETGETLAETLSDVAALHRLRSARLGMVGEPSDWLVASVPDRARLRERWGIELVDVDIGDTIRRHRTDEADDAFEAARPVAVHVIGRGDPDHETLRAAALHPALVATIDREHVDAVAVRCFDFLQELSTSGCVALAALNDSGVVAGCEGDVASTVAMMLLRALLDQPGWIANPAWIDVSSHRVVLAHCTVAPSMVDAIEVHTHFESGLGIGLRGSFAPGSVTLVRLGGEALERHWFADAEVVESGDSPDLCRTQVTLRVDGDRLESLLEDPLGNHLVMVRGRHRDRLERWWRLAFGSG